MCTIREAVCRDGDKPDVLTLNVAFCCHFGMLKLLSQSFISHCQQNDGVEETPATKPIVGIIYPPPEVRNIVDKTASFVARLVNLHVVSMHFPAWGLSPDIFLKFPFFLFYRNGPEFEARIRQNEINNPKFNFLNPNDPYHAYYRHKVNEFKEGKAQEPSAAVPKVMQQTMQQTQQLPQKVWFCFYIRFPFFPIHCEWQILFCIVFSIDAGDSRADYPQRTTSWVWVYCRSTIYFSIWPGCGQAYCPVCCSKWPSVSHSAHAERTEELPVRLSTPTAQSF